MTTATNDLSLRRTRWGLLLGDILTLKTPAFLRFRDHPNGMRYAIGLLIVVSLLAGSINFIWQALRSPVADMQSARQVFEQVLAQMETTAGIPPEVFAMIRQQFEAGLGIAEGIIGLPTPLPAGVSRFMQTLGEWLSQPFVRLGGWLGYGIWVILLARLLLGAKGSLRDFMTVTPLYSAPLLLTILTPVPCLGSLLGLVASVWSWLVYTKATAVSLGWVQQSLDDQGAVVAEQTQWGRALLAVLLPAVLLFAVSLVGLIVLAVTATIGGSN